MFFVSVSNIGHAFNLKCGATYENTHTHSNSDCLFFYFLCSEIR